MTTAFPSALDSYADPAGGSVQGSTTPTHSGHHTNHNDAIEALEAKLGTGVGAATANTVLRGTGAGTTGYGQIVSADITDGTIATADLAAGAVTQRIQSTTFTGTRSAAGYVDVDSTNGKVTLTTTGGDLLVLFSGSVVNTSAAVDQRVALKLDSGADAPTLSVYSYPSAGSYPMPFTLAYLFTSLAAGSHTVSARHTNNSASGTMTTTGFMLAVELRR